MHDDDKEEEEEDTDSRVFCSSSIGDHDQDADDNDNEADVDASKDVVAHEQSRDTSLIDPWYICMVVAERAKEQRDEHGRVVVSVSKRHYQNTLIFAARQPHELIETLNAGRKWTPEQAVELSNVMTQIISPPAVQAPKKNASSSSAAATATATANGSSHLPAKRTSRKKATKTRAAATAKSAAPNEQQQTSTETKTSAAVAVISNNHKDALLVSTPQPERTFFPMPVTAAAAAAADQTASLVRRVSAALDLHGQHLTNITQFSIHGGGGSGSGASNPTILSLAGDWIVHMAEAIRTNDATALAQQLEKHVQGLDSVCEHLQTLRTQLIDASKEQILERHTTEHCQHGEQWILSLEQLRKATDNERRRRKRLRQEEITTTTTTATTTTTESAVSTESKKNSEQSSSDKASGKKKRRKTNPATATEKKASSKKKKKQKTAANSSSSASSPSARTTTPPKVPDKKKKKSSSGKSVQTTKPTDAAAATTTTEVVASIARPTYKIGMVMGPVLNFEAAKTIGVIWNLKGRGLIPRSALGELLAHHFKLPIYADLAVVFEGKEFEHHVLKQTPYGELWLVENQNVEAFDKLLLVPSESAKESD